MLCALTVLAQIAVTLLLTRFLKEKASFVYGFLQLIGAVVAIRVYQRSGSPSYKLSWMCLLLILPVSGMKLFCGSSVVIRHWIATPLYQISSC